MNITNEIQKFYLISCPDGREVIARPKRMLDSEKWWDEDVWELQEISYDWYPISATACMSRSKEAPHGWSVECEGSSTIKNEAILHAYQFLTEELG